MAGTCGRCVRPGTRALAISTSASMEGPPGCQALSCLPSGQASEDEALMPDHLRNVTSARCLETMFRV